MYYGQLLLDINKSIIKAISSPFVPLTYVVRNTGITKKKLRCNWLVATQVSQNTIDYIDWLVRIV